MSEPVAISLFSGAGGLDLGCEQAGFTVAAACEPNDDAADTLEKNLGAGLRSPVLRRSVIGLDGDELREAAGLLARERPDVLIGGPPCTPFSKSGFWLDWKRAGLDPDASLLQEYTRLLAELRPRTFLLENVYALTFDNRASRPHFERLLAEIAEAGYRCRWRVLNAADYGVAQARPRLFVVGAVRGRRVPRLPVPTHHGRWEGGTTGLEAGRPHRTAGEALADLESTPEPEEVVGGKHGHLLADIPPGDNYLYYTARRDHPEPRFEWRSRYWSFLLKLDPARPSPTIQAQPGPNVGPFHWESRRLRVPELKRLFSFPDDFELVGRRSAVQAQLGNSVPPLLARQVAAEVRSTLG